MVRSGRGERAAPGVREARGGSGGKETAGGRAKSTADEERRAGDGNVFFSLKKEKDSGGTGDGLLRR